ncbi:MAG: hypothetical protein PHV16_04720 [Candidatus Nanoarchaeia archaeon]|nr:hypothetical protein [Candidatus Nanoarchaeia archaeon]
MLCEKCKKNKGEINLPYLGHILCRRCFCNLIQRRVKKEIKQKKIIEENEKVLLIDDKSIEARISEILINSIYKKVKLTKKQVKGFSLGQIDKPTILLIKKEKISKVVIPWNLDKEINYFTECVFSGNKTSKIGHYNEQNIIFVKLLRNVLESECDLLAEFNNIDIKRNQEKDKKIDDIKGLINRINKKHCETKFSLLKSIDKLNKIIK